jgi:hypothetical protein
VSFWIVSVKKAKAAQRAHSAMSGALRQNKKIKIKKKKQLKIITARIYDNRSIMNKKAQILR